MSLYLNFRIFLCIIFVYGASANDWLACAKITTTNSNTNYKQLINCPQTAGFVWKLEDNTGICGLTSRGWLDWEWPNDNSQKSLGYYVDTFNEKGHIIPATTKGGQDDNWGCAIKSDSIWAVTTSVYAHRSKGSITVFYASENCTQRLVGQGVGTEKTKLENTSSFDACRLLVMQTHLSAYGATWGVTSQDQDGECYADKDITRTNGDTKWVTCLFVSTRTSTEDCPIQFTGTDVTVSSQETNNLTTKKFPELTKIDGNLIFLTTRARFRNIEFPRLTIEFPRLAVIADSIILIKYQTLAILKFPVLSLIGLDMEIRGNNKLTEIYFPTLTSICGFMMIKNNMKLKQITFPKLKNIQSYINIQGNRELKSLHFSQLLSFNSANKSCDEEETYDTVLCMSDNIMLGLADFPMLTIITNNLLIWGDMLNFPQLVTIMRDLILTETLMLNILKFPQLRLIRSNLIIWDNSLIFEVKLPLLARIDDALEIGKNNVLTNVYLPVLQRIDGHILFWDNAALKNIYLPKLVFCNTKSSKSYCDTNGEIDRDRSANGEIDICIMDNPVLEVIDFPSLKSLGFSMSLQRNNALITISFCQMDTFKGSFGIDGSKNTITIVLCGDIPFKQFKIANRSDLIGCDAGQKVKCFPTTSSSSTPMVLPTHRTLRSHTTPSIEQRLMPSNDTSKRLARKRNNQQNKTRDTTRMSGVTVLLVCGLLILFMVVILLVVRFCHWKRNILNISNISSHHVGGKHVRPPELTDSTNKLGIREPANGYGQNLPIDANIPEVVPREKFRIK